MVKPPFFPCIKYSHVEQGIYYHFLTKANLYIMKNTIFSLAIAIVFNITNLFSQELALANLSSNNIFSSKNHSIPTAEPDGNEPEALTLSLLNEGLLALPDDVLGQTHFQAVRLDGNFLEKLPASIARWSQCRTLSLANNRLAELPVAIGELVNLESMDLTKNHLEQLPASIARLAGLDRLTIDLNYLSSLPAEIAGLKSLRSLSVQHNMLRSLPASIGQLKNLEMLTLTDNQLTTLPEEIGQLTNLKMLRIDNNHIQQLPASIANLKGNLRLLVLTGNPLGKQKMAEIKAMLPNTVVEFK